MIIYAYFQLIFGRLAQGGVLDLPLSWHEQIWHLNRGSNPTTTDDIIYTLVSSAVGHLCQCKGSMNVQHWVKLIDTYSLGHWGRADVVPDVLIPYLDTDHWN